jgi:hypothetical protein
MNTTISKLTSASATDADAVYIKGKIAEAYAADEATESSREHAAVARIEAGQRLIEVKTARETEASRQVSKGGRGHTNPFNDWLDANGIARKTASDLMRNAGWTKEQREEHKAKERERKASKPKTSYGWMSALQHFSGLHMQFGGSQAKTLSKAVGYDVTKWEYTESEARELAAQAAALFTPKADVAEEREALSETAQQKFDRLLAKALAQQKAEQAKTYWNDVNAKALEVMPDRIRKIEEQNRALRRDNAAMLRGAGAVITLEEFRKLRKLHSDQQLSAADRDELFQIVMKLEPWIAAYNRN